jgi:altronate dehydratase
LLQSLASKNIGSLRGAKTKENKMNTITVKVTPHDSKRFAIMVKVDGKTMLCEIAETYQEADLRIPVLKQRAITQFNLAQELERKHS